MSVKRCCVPKCTDMKQCNGDGGPRERRRRRGRWAVGGAARALRAPATASPRATRRAPRAAPRARRPPRPPPSGGCGGAPYGPGLRRRFPSGGGVPGAASHALATRPRRRPLRAAGLHRVLANFRAVLPVRFVRFPRVRRVSRRRRGTRAGHSHRSQEPVPAEGLRPGPAAAAAALRAAPQPARLAPGRHAPVPAAAGGGARAGRVGLGGGAGARARAARRQARARQAHADAEAPARAAHGRALQPVRPHARRARARVRRRAVLRRHRPVLAHLPAMRTCTVLRKDVAVSSVHKRFL